MPRKCPLVQQGDRKRVRPQKWANGHFLHKNYFRCRNPAARTPPALRKVGARLAVGWPSPCGRLARCLLQGRLLFADEQPSALPPVKFLSHTYGMGIVACHYPSHRNGWLPIFDAYGIFLLPMRYIHRNGWPLDLRSLRHIEEPIFDAYGIFLLPMRYIHRNGWLPMSDANDLFDL